MKNAMRTSAATALALIVCACADGTPPADAGAEWIGTVTTDGNVTTVVNESGSVWGGAATLEQELSIGVDIGEPHYMFASIRSLLADDRHIYVGELRPPVIRVYDHDGNHVRDIGREGQGPGEFARPDSVIFLTDGNLLVRDDGNNRFTVFTPEGDLVETWAPWEGGFSAGRPTIQAADGTVYLPAPVGRNPETRRSIWGYRAWGPEGETGEPLWPPTFDYEQPRLTHGNSWGSVPMSPDFETALSPSGIWIAGLSNEYRFEIRFPDGRVTVVERRIDPVLMSHEERDWRTRATTASWRRETPDWRWNGPPIPDTKPYYISFFADHSDRIWVRTHGPSTPVAGCNPDPKPEDDYSPCWRSGSGYDVFGIDGRYLGSLDLSGGLETLVIRSAYIRADTIVAQMQDEAGTIMIKRYRIVLPGERGE